MFGVAWFEEHELYLFTIGLGSAFLDAFKVPESLGDVAIRPLPKLEVIRGQNQRIIVGVVERWWNTETLFEILDGFLPTTDQVSPELLLPQTVGRHGSLEAESAARQPLHLRRLPRWQWAAMAAAEK